LKKPKAAQINPNVMIKEAWKASIDQARHEARLQQFLKILSGLLDSGMTFGSTPLGDWFLTTRQAYQPDWRQTFERLILLDRLLSAIEPGTPVFSAFAVPPGVSLQLCRGVATGQPLDPQPSIFHSWSPCLGLPIKGVTQEIYAGQIGLGSLTSPVISAEALVDLTVARIGTVECVGYSILQPTLLLAVGPETDRVQSWLEARHLLEQFERMELMVRGQYPRRQAETASQSAEETLVEYLRRLADVWDVPTPDRELIGASQPH
jgi:hypothetical protein